MAQYRIGSGQYRNRGKTYAKRAAVAGGTWLGLSALLTGSRRGRRFMGRVANAHLKRGSSQLGRGLIKNMKQSAGFRRKVRGVTGTAARVLGRLIRR